MSNKFTGQNWFGVDPHAGEYLFGEASKRQTALRKAAKELGITYSGKKLDDLEAELDAEDKAREDQEKERISQQSYDRISQNAAGEQPAEKPVPAATGQPGTTTTGKTASPEQAAAMGYGGSPTKPGAPAAKSVPVDATEPGPLAAPGAGAPLDFAETTPSATPSATLSATPPPPAATAATPPPPAVTAATPAVPDDQLQQQAVQLAESDPSFIGELVKSINDKDTVVEFIKAAHARGDRPDHLRVLIDMWKNMSIPIRSKRPEDIQVMNAVHDADPQHKEWAQWILDNMRAKLDFADLEPLISDLGITDTSGGDWTQFQGEIDGIGNRAQEKQLLLHILKSPPALESVIIPNGQQLIEELTKLYAARDLLLEAEVDPDRDHLDEQDFVSQYPAGRL